MTSDEPAPPTPARRYAQKSLGERRQERRQRLLNAALDAFGEDGYRGTTIDTLCTAAGVSTRNFYEEFGSREAIVIALHDDLNARALDAVLAALDGTDPDDIATRASLATAAYLRVMTSDRRWARVALVESVGVSPEAEAHRRAATVGFVQLLQAEGDQLTGSGVIPPRDHHLTAVALAGALNGLVNTWTGETNWDDSHVDRIAAEATRLIVLGFTG